MSNRLGKVYESLGMVKSIDKFDIFTTPTF